MHLEVFERKLLTFLTRWSFRGVEPDVVTWNGLITGFTQCGEGETALEFFSRMVQTDMQPNTISLSGVLAACAQVKVSN